MWFFTICLRNISPNFPNFAFFDKNSIAPKTIEIIPRDPIHSSAKISLEKILSGTSITINEIVIMRNSMNGWYDVFLLLFLKKVMV